MRRADDGGSPISRRCALVAGNIALLLPPLAPLYVVLSTRRRAWRGRQAFSGARLPRGRLLWFVGQLGWAADELFRVDRRCRGSSGTSCCSCRGSALPLIALVAWPHRSGAGRNRDHGGDRHRRARLPHRLPLLVADHRAGRPIPRTPSIGLRALAIIGPIVRLASVAGLLLAAASAGKSAWAGVYRRLALGMGLAFVILVVLS